MLHGFTTLRQDYTRELLLCRIGKDEMNLVEFPVTLLSKQQTGKKVLSFSDTVRGQDKKPVVREWTVIGSDEYGLPLAHDNDLWLILLQLARMNKFSTWKLYVSRHGLCRRMHLRTCGSAYERIEASLNRLKGVTIVAKNAWYDKVTKEYLTREFGLIDDFMFSTDASRTDSPATDYVCIDRAVLESLQKGYVKNLDIRQYFTLSGYIAKRLYRYLDKKRYKDNRFEISLHTLAYSHIGFDPESYPCLSMVKSKLKKAHEELKRIGYLKHVKFIPMAGQSMEKVVYAFHPRTALTKPFTREKPENPVDDHAAEDKDAETSIHLKNRLAEIGISGRDAADLVRNHTVEEIESQIAALPHRNAHSPAGFLFKAIQGGWRIPEIIANERERERRIQERRIRQEEHAAMEEMEKVWINNYLSSLSIAEYKALTDAARQLALHDGSNIFCDNDIPEPFLNGYRYEIARTRLMRMREEK